MSYEQEFRKEFEAWVNTQIMINDMALRKVKKVSEEDQDERAKRCHDSLRESLGCLSVLVVSLKELQSRQRDSMICQKACLVSRIIKRERFLIFH